MLNTRQKLVHAVTEHDRKAAKGKRYNMWALPQYLRAIDEAMFLIDDGLSVRAALCQHFSGRLLDAVLKAVGETKSTDAEQRLPAGY
jgi:alkyl hydroperoxide reductase subunit AhpC